MPKPTLYMMFGYPGSGKTTTAQIVHELTGAVHLSSDAIRLELFPQPTYGQAEHDTVYTTLNRRTEALLREGKSVVYDANLNRYIHRAEKYDICQRTGAAPVLLWLQTPKEFARDRAVLRGHHHLVPKDETFEGMFDRVAGTLEEPRANEHPLILNGQHVDTATVSRALNQTPVLSPID